MDKEEYLKHHARPKVDKPKRKWRNPKQKIIAMIMFLIGVGSIFVEYDVTAFIFLFIISTWLFFSKTRMLEGAYSDE